MLELLTLKLTLQQKDGVILLKIKVRDRTKSYYDEE
jgi:hypothetical protein